VARGRRLSIGARWALRYSSATFFLIGLLAAYLYGQISKQILSGAREELVRQTAAVSETIARNSDDFRVIAEFVETAIAGANPDLRLAIELLDRNGNVVLRRDILAPLAPPPAESHRSSSQERFFYEVASEDGYPYFGLVEANGRGFTHVAVHSAPYLASVAQVRNQFLLTAPICLALTGMLGWWLARRSLQPISVMTDTARRISATTTDESIPLRGSGDELDLLAETLNGMLNRIREGMDRMRKFAAEAAHELRTPLSIIRSRLEVTLANEESEPVDQRILRETLKDIDQLGSEVDSMLRFARSEAGITPGESEAVDLDALIRPLIDFFSPPATEQGIALSYTSSGAVCVNGDATWLHQLVANLVDNAIKYTGPDGKVGVNLYQRGSQVEVAVQDTGPGIDPAELDRIFERFGRGRRQSGSKGTGLGLALSKRIAEAHGGTIVVESEPGEGSTFTVRLPVMDLE
jgi:heavy metal sensor kinase